MRPRDTFVENALDWLLGEALGRAFSGALEALGINPKLAGILISLAAMLAAMWVWRKFKSWEEPRWEEINPDDPKAVEGVFYNAHHVRYLAQKLREDEAGTIEELQAQLRRLNYFGKDVWDRQCDRLDPRDDELMRSLYSRRHAARDLARKIGSSPARTLDEFKDQIHQLQSGVPRSRESVRIAAKESAHH